MEDTVGKALQLINDFKVTHLPVVSEEKFLGLISEDDLLDAENKNILIDSCRMILLHASVKENEHFLKAVNFSNQYQTNVVPVVNAENEFVGSYIRPTILKTLGNFTAHTKSVAS